MTNNKTEIAELYVKMDKMHKHIEEVFPYDGSQIDASWAFK